MTVNPTKKARVYVLYTGGTIGMVPKEPGNPASPLVPGDKSQLQRYAHGLEEKGIDWIIEGLVDLDGKEVPPIDSSDIDADHWKFMAAQIERVYNDYHGFVILHGTDTMAYTASALSFLLENLAKPVVVTGSQLPISSVRTDGVQNFVNAIYIAGYKAAGLPCIPEVIICFGDSILRGNRTRKVSSSSWQGFDTPNFPKLGTIGEHIKINTSLLRPAANNEDTPFYAHTTLCTDVMDVGLFPGLKPAPLKSLLQLEAIKGVVLRTYGAGNAPGNKAFLDVIELAVKGVGRPGKTILNVTQCTQGTVEMGVYAASSGLLERGVISGLDITPEAALAKMMWILETQTGNEIQSQLQIDQRGEQTGSLFDVRYGACGDSSESVGLVSVSASPAGKFRKSNLVRAVLRVSHLGITDTQIGDEIELKVFINLPTADSNTPTKDRRFATTFHGAYQGPEATSFIEEVTSTVRTVAEEGHPIHVSVIPPKGKKIWYQGLYLALFA